MHLVYKGNGTLRFFAFALLALFSTITKSQTPGALKQAVFTTGGTFLAEGNRVKVYSFRPNIKSTIVVDSILGDFSNDVEVDQHHAFIHVGRAGSNPAGNDIIYRYDLNTYKRIDSINNIPGVQKILVYKNYLLVTRGYGSSEHFFNIFDKNNLKSGPIFSDAGILSPTSGVVVLSDTAYVSYTKDNIGKIARIDLSTGLPSHVDDISFDTLSSGVSDLFTDGEKVFGLSEKFDANSYELSYAGIIIFHPTTKSKRYVKVASAHGGIGIFKNQLLGNFTGTGISAFDLQEEKLIPGVRALNYSAAALDTFTGNYLVQQTNYYSYGRILVASNDLSKVDTLITDISGSAMALEYNDVVTGIIELKGPERISIFPNPSSGQINIEGNFISGSGRVTITDASGRLVLQISDIRREEKIDVGKLANGLYYLKLSNGKDTYIDKFVKF